MSAKGQPDVIHGVLPARPDGLRPTWRSRLRTRAEVRDAEQDRAFRARIDAARPLVAGAGQLRWLVPPDLLKGG